MELAFPLEQVAWLELRAQQWAVQA